MMSGSPSEETSTGDIFLAIGFIMEAFLLFAANLLTVLTFTLNRHLRKRGVYCVINLAVADMLVGLVATVSSCVILGMFGVGGVIDREILTTSRPWTPYVGALYIVVLVGTMSSLTLVGVERMVATVWPLRHRAASSWLYPVLISTTWIIVVIVGVVSGVLIFTSTNGYQNFSVVAGVGISMLLFIISSSYISIFIKVKSQQRQMVGSRTSSRADRGLVMTLFIVTVVSLVTWIPMGVVYILRVVSDVYIPSMTHLVGVALGLANSLLNPFVYLYRMRDFRRAIYHLVFRCSLDRPNRIIPMHRIGNQQN